MDIGGNIITFKSRPEYFNLEKSGIKNNTVRISTIEEALQIQETIKSHSKGSTLIHIMNTETEEDFYRIIRNVSVLQDYRVVGEIVIIAWDENKEVN